MKKNKSENMTLGICLMIATTFVFAVQDVISRYLAEEYNAITIVMIRYWFFGLFVICINFPLRKDFSKKVKSKHPFLQIFRGAILACEVCVMVFAFTKLGLVESHAIFACYPLIVFLLSGPVLKEKINFHQWTAIFCGFCGIIILLKPGSEVFNIYAIIPLTSAMLFAIYNILTRQVALSDSSETSYFWTGISGTFFISLIGPFFWQPIHVNDWQYMALLCISGAIGHYLLIKTLEVAEVSVVQPYAYFQLIFASGFGLIFFREELTLKMFIGTSIVLLSGLYAFVRSQEN